MTIIKASITFRKQSIHQIAKMVTIIYLETIRADGSMFEHDFSVDGSPCSSTHAKAFLMFPDMAYRVVRESIDSYRVRVQITVED